MTDDAILALIRKRLMLPELDSKLDPDATFADLHLNSIDGWSIAVDIEDEMGRELDWKRVEAWGSVRDVIETAAMASVEHVP